MDERQGNPAGPIRHVSWPGVALLAALALLLPASATAATVDPSQTSPLATVEPGFVSFGVDASQLYERSSGAPFDFARPRLLTLAKALAPAYIRYSGTKIETTYYDDSNELGPGAAPPGYAYVLSRDEWVAALDFARRAGLDAMVSTSAGPGPRLPDGAWDPANARALLGRARSQGLPIAAIQLGNEPNITYYGSGMSNDYTADDYARDVADFLQVKRQLAPEATFVGPGPFFTTGAEQPLLNARLGPSAEEIMAATGSKYDVVSYHQYPAFGDSDKCLMLTPRLPDDTLAAPFLDLPAGARDYMAGLRDRYAPGRPLWIDESSNTACGGIDDYSDKFISTFYYLSSLGYLARSGVGVVTRWTLSGPQPYALIDDATLTPRADYWAALLWRRLMGRQVLEPTVSGSDPELRVYSQCTPADLRAPEGAGPGGVTTLLMNTSRTEAKTIDLGADPAHPSGVYLVTGALGGETASLNGTELALGPDGELPATDPSEQTGPVTLPPASYAFVTSPFAANPDCGGPARKKPLGLRLNARPQSLRRIVRTGRIVAACRIDHEGRCRVKATIPRRQARRLKLRVPRGQSRRAIAGSTVRVKAGRATAVRLTVGRAVRRRLAKVRRPRGVAIALTATGNSPSALPGRARSIRLKLRR